MPKTKYQQVITQMYDDHAELFNQFQVIHDGYKQDRKQWSQQFHTVGKQVVEILREAEQRLCASMERGIHSGYSSKLAEKFWLEIKKRYSHIDLVGVKSNLD